MKVIFDLDYTLLDTARFKDKLAEIFSEQDFYADYKKYFKDQGVSFEIDKYLAILKGEERIDQAKIKELNTSLNELMENLDEYLRPDAENVLKHFKKEGAGLVLMTFGDKKWQAEKINHLSIGKYFDKIIFEEKDKSQSEYLKSLSDGNEEILIINDNLAEVEEMLKILKRGESRLVDGPYAGGKEVRVNKLAELIPEKQEAEEVKELNLK